MKHMKLSVNVVIMNNENTDEERQEIKKKIKNIIEMDKKIGCHIGDIRELLNQISVELRNIEIERAKLKNSIHIIDNSYNTKTQNPNTVVISVQNPLKWVPYKNRWGNWIWRKNSSPWIKINIPKDSSHPGVTPPNDYSEPKVIDGKWCWI